ncbi:MAG: hypothetical protein CVT48_00795 [Thermoplasmata archaeon HGW-Thermoplasmata-1]|nr:MAG: hypothetical protein CVT48_00795 [Thermoplasmata archaeon HGW-Thermoplasmata-1]
MRQNRIRIDGKEVTEPDRFVLDCAAIIERTTPYVIVSGYVAIFFGRARGTEDADMLIPQITETAFLEMHENLSKAGYYFLNPEDAAGLYDMPANDKLGVRIAENDSIIPNMELKFVKDDFDNFSFNSGREVVFGENRLYFPPLEIQISYKLRLGSEKDIEDAIYLHEMAKGPLDSELMKKFFKKLGVRGNRYGIQV